MYVIWRIIKSAVKLILLVSIIFLGYVLFQFKVKKNNTVTLGPVKVISVENSYQIQVSTSENGIIKQMTDKLNGIIFQPPVKDQLPDDTNFNQANKKDKAKDK